MYFTNSECCCFRAVILSLCIADSVWMSFFRMLKQPLFIVADIRVLSVDDLPDVLREFFNLLIPNRHDIPSPHCFDRNRVFQLVSETLDIYRQRVVFHKAAAFVPDAFENLTRLRRTPLLEAKISSRRYSSGVSSTGSPDA